MKKYFYIFCMVNNFISLDLASNYFATSTLKKGLIVNSMHVFDMADIVNLLKRNPDICCNTGISINAMYKSFVQQNGNNSKEVFVCKDTANSKVVGFLSGHFRGLNNQDFYIAMVGVDCDYRGLGIATALLDTTYDFAKNNYCKQLIIHPVDTISERCYEKFGFNLDPKKSGSFLMYKKIK